MRKLLWAEWLKTKRSALRWLVVLLPALMGLVLAWYVVGRPWISAASAFSGFFSCWASLVLPFLTAIAAGQLAAEEEGAGAFTGFLLSAKPRVQLYFGKLLMLILLLAAATLLATLVFCGGLWLGGYENTLLDFYVRAAIVCWLAILPLAALHLWLAFAAGLGVSVGVGIGGVLVAALIGGTLLGDGIWPFVPWAWPLRLAMIHSVLQAAQLNAEQLASLSSQSTLACLLALLGGIVVTAASVWWFSRWEGRHRGE